MNFIKNILFVFLGGGMGSVVRYGFNLMVTPLFSRFPLATLLANGAACFVLGILLAHQMSGSISDQKRLLMATGFCGGFSTFSTFTAETWGLWENGQIATALLNIVLSIVVSFVGLFLGLKIYN